MRNTISISDQPVNRRRKKPLESDAFPF